MAIDYSALFYFTLIIYEINLTNSQDCSSSPGDIDYMGSVSKTKSNKTCEQWSKFYDFHQGLYVLDLVDSLEDARNFCRNPKGSQQKEKAWCFTDIENEQWEFCDIPRCMGCSRVHGISHGTVQIINRNIYPDKSFQPGTQIEFSCEKNSIYDQYSGPLSWTCTEENQWSENELPTCLYRGFLVPTDTPNCWYYSQTEFFNDGSPRKLYYGRTNSDSNGIRCLNWINAKQYTDQDFPQEGKSNALNYCRSPDNYGNGPKCLINNYRDISSCDVPKCVGCAAIPYIKYAVYSLNFEKNETEYTAKEGSYLTFRCSAGNLAGPSTLVCKNGIWGSELPSCSVKFCSQPPPSPSNSISTFNRLIYANMEDFGKEYLTFDDSTYIFECSRGYRFEDESVSQLVFGCYSGEWILNGKFSNCVPAEINTSTQTPGEYCKVPDEVKNGYRVKSSIKKAGPNQYYGEFEIACYSSFVLRGDPIVRCINGNWSPYPTCERQASCPLDIIEKPALNVEIISSKLLYNPEGTGITVGSNVFYECLPGYSPEYSPDDLTVTCLETGEWSTRIPVRCI